jgi:hypothetical protein
MLPVLAVNCRGRAGEDVTDADPAFLGDGLGMPLGVAATLALAMLSKAADWCCARPVLGGRTSPGFMYFFIRGGRRLAFAEFGDRGGCSWDEEERLSESIICGSCDMATGCPGRLAAGSWEGVRVVVEEGDGWMGGLGVSTVLGTVLCRGVLVADGLRLSYRKRQECCVVVVWPPGSAKSGAVRPVDFDTASTSLDVIT